MKRFCFTEQEYDYLFNLMDVPNANTRDWWLEMDKQCWDHVHDCLIMRDNGFTPYFDISDEDAEILKKDLEDSTKEILRQLQNDVLWGCFNEASWSNSGHCLSLISHMLHYFKA